MGLRIVFRLGEIWNCPEVENFSMAEREALTQALEGICELALHLAHGPAHEELAGLAARAERASGSGARSSGAGAQASRGSGSS